LPGGNGYHRARQVFSPAQLTPDVNFRSQMGPFETIYIDETVAACNGGGGPLGHPKVYLNLGPAGKIECPYCSRLFVNRAMQGTDEGEAVTPPRVSEERNV
jgi:uncharacterized Zn-finger protein